MLDRALKFKHIPVYYNVPGNHDIGFGDDVSKHAVDRFTENFGAHDTTVPTGSNEIQVKKVVNTKVTVHSHDLIFLDTISLSNTVSEEIWGPPREFMDSLAKETKINPRIMFNHVPFYREVDKSTCGPLREGGDPFPIVKGYRFQSVIEHDLSAEVLSKIQPSIEFAGDDHNYCEAFIPYKVDKSFDKTPELKQAVKDFSSSTVTNSAMTVSTKFSKLFKRDDDKSVISVNVKSISMAMGIRFPAVELLTLHDSPVIPSSKTSLSSHNNYDTPTTFEYDVCFLTLPYQDIVFYSFYAFFNFLYLVYFCSGNRVHGNGPKYISLASENVYMDSGNGQRIGSRKVMGLMGFIQSLAIKKLLELCAVESVLVLALYNFVFTIHAA
ncbi:unnamed protein product [Ambrosiozyma monospora]|uniref:Unnamed protein product n=1 Tax=Ambrosiozyma monospora TaxID=43982 RepID=A0A9W6Z9I1_AMBMO|nr:unnamed protein product [Ambrosiozyma monospora]